MMNLARELIVDSRPGRICTEQSIRRTVEAFLAASAMDAP